jgi:hypothetical protein
LRLDWAGARLSHRGVAGRRGELPDFVRIARGRWLLPAMAAALAVSPRQAAAQHSLADPLKPHQEITRGTPPLPPTRFDPDPNRIPIPGNAAFGPATNLIRSVTVSSNAPPVPPPLFNPDPGAWSVTAPPPAPPAFLRDEPVLSPLFTPPPISGEQALPRENVRSSIIGPPPPVEPGPTTGYEPLPPEQALPREDTRRNLRIESEWHTPHYSFHPPPPHTMPQPDRWRVGFVPWRRYTSGSIEQPYETHEPKLWHPYEQSVLKGDVPIIGDDIFLNLTAATQTEVEFRRVPVASGVSAATPGAAEFYGESEQIGLQNNIAFSALLFRGETAFKPVEWAVKIQPVYNINYLEARETGVVSPDPRGVLGGGQPNTPPPFNGGIIHPSDLDDFLNGLIGPAAASYRGTRSTTRRRDYLALQEYFVELHLGDLSDNYDFYALKIGNQVFNSDFRGFVFNDINLGARVFGSWRNNRYQYNLALFDQREKDTNSELNTFDDRDQRVLVANFYWQDFLWKGYTAQWSFHANWDEAGIHYDKNGNIVRPAPIGTVRPHDVQAYYLGWAGDGHIGRFNLSHAFYQVFGRDDFNGLAGRPVDLNAQMAALELSYDQDWIRYKLSAFFASGDGDTEDGTARGFDTILDNPNFTGGPFSWWVRQGFNLGGTAVNLKPRGSLVPNLRTSKTQGQANFVNPGVFLVGVGTDLEVTPELRAFVNANYIRFVNTDPIQTALLTAKVDEEFGWDLSLGVQWRPLLTDNIIVSAGFGVLLPGQGFKDIYRTSTDPVPTFDPPDRRGFVDSFLYSAVLALNLTY